MIDTEEGAHRGQRGQQARHPDRRRRRHELRSRRHRLRDPGQRRRDPRDPLFVRPTHRRRRGQRAVELIEEPPARGGSSPRPKRDDARTAVAGGAPRRASERASSAPAAEDDVDAARPRRNEDATMASQRPAGEGAAREDRRRHDGLQEGPRRGRRRHRQGRRDPAQEGHRQRPRSARAARPAEGLVGSYIHSDGTGGRAGRGQLRDRLRRAHTRFQPARARHRAAHRGSATRSGSSREDVPADDGRPRARDLRGTGARRRASRDNVLARSSKARSRSSSPRLLCSSSPTCEDDKQTVGQLRQARHRGKLGENITVRRFAHFAGLGEQREAA